MSRERHCITTHDRAAGCLQHERFGRDHVSGWRDAEAAPVELARFVITGADGARATIVPSPRNGSPRGTARGRERNGPVIDAPPHGEHALRVDARLPRRRDGLWEQGDLLSEIGNADVRPHGIWVERSTGRNPPREHALYPSVQRCCYSCFAMAGVNLGALQR